ncbi:HTH-type transcriptional repressor AseR [compost metagenome]
MQEVEKVVDVLKLLSDKNRLTIISLLREKELCVCELVDILKTSQPNISQHLRKLKDGGLIKETKKGQWGYYSLLPMDEHPLLIDVLKYVPTQKNLIDEIACQDSNCCS